MRAEEYDEILGTVTAALRDYQKMNALAHIQRDLKVITDIAARAGIRSQMLLDATYSIETNARAYMEDCGTAVEWKTWRLTKKEARICALLHKRLGKTVSKSALLDTIYFDNQEAEERLEDANKIIDVFICHTKKKLEDSPYCIDNDWGQGYRMTEKMDWAPYRLSPREQLLAATLYSRLGYEYSPDNLLAILYPKGYKGRRGYEAKTPLRTLHVLLCKARQKLQISPFRISFQLASGYRMSFDPNALALTALQELQAH